MKRLLLLFVFIPSLAMAQDYHPRTLDELINTEEPGWELVMEWKNQGANQVEILERDSNRAAEALLQTQVTTRSPMGAIIYETGGILIDHGWLRILGSGHPRLNRSLPTWNKGKTISRYGEQPSFLLVADDIAGGFFAINNGALGNDIGKMYYFAPDALQWEAMEISYSQFIWWAFNGDLDDYYANLRWKTWENDIKNLDGNQGLSFSPFLWLKHDDINNRSRKAVSVAEIWSLQQDMARQLGQ